MAHTKADTGLAGSGQIHNPWARIPVQIADAIGSGIFPRIAQFIPGTEAHHELEVGRAQGGVNGESAEQTAADKSAQEQAQTANLETLPELHKTQAELAARKEADRVTQQSALLGIAGRKVGETETSHRNTEAGKDSARKATLAQHGFEENEKGEIVPLAYDRMSEPQQAVYDLKSAQTELAEANKAYADAKTKNAPALMELAKRRIDNANHTASTAERRLGLSEKQFELRSEGTVGGVQPAGGMQTETGQPVGTAFQQNVRPTGTQRDAAGRADTMLDLDGRIRKALQNPEIAKGVGPIAGRLNEIENRLGTLPKDLSTLKQDLISYGAFQAGLHPVRGIGALQYFDKVMGGLGQDPEELTGKLDSNKQTAQNVKKVGDMKTQGGKTGSTKEPETIHVKNTEDYDKVPSGSKYIDPKGVERTKK